MLRASLAERLGHVTAAEAERREREERTTIDRRMHLLGGAAVRKDETAAERALRRAGHSACPLLRRGLLAEPRVGAWCGQDDGRFGGARAGSRWCSRAPAGHTLELAKQVRAFGVAVMGSGEEQG